LLYEEGQGVKQDYGKAFEWYGKAAAQGDAAAQYGLAVLYEDGLGRPKNKEEALRWYRRAAEGGDKDARLVLAHLDRGDPDFGKTRPSERRTPKDAKRKASQNAPKSKKKSGKKKGDGSARTLSEP
jgi:TPR repeat protein